MQHKINIAIDGLSSTGKSTLARSLAKKIGYTYIDSGAMYRAIAFYAIENNVELTALPHHLKNIKLQFIENEIHLGNKNIEQQIRTMSVANIVSEVAAIPAVRDFCVQQQQTFGQAKGVVMDGRDIGTVVFPSAELKIFLGASQTVRVERRYKELIAKGQNITKESVAQNLAKRDQIDSTREYNPLRKADDAIDLDNSELSVEDQLDFIINWVNDRLQSIETD